MELQELIDNINIREYISQFVELEEKNGEWWGLSPFKEENTPSFSVREESNNFYCFSSGIGGSVITFVKHYYHCSTSDAIERLKQYAGIDGALSSSTQKLSATTVCKQFKKPKAHNSPPRAKELPDDCMAQYELRDNKLDVWRAEGISDQSIERFQVKYDPFSNRLVYPIRNPKGKIVNIGGRTLDHKWKEKGLRKYTYFKGWDGAMQVIYGLSENMAHILESKEVIVFEGCKSVLIADSWGIKNCVAILTSHVNPYQMKLFAKLGCRVVFALDKDVRIREDHNIGKLRNYVQVEYLYDAKDLLDNKDAPVDKGKEVFKTLYEQRLRYR